VFVKSGSTPSLVDTNLLKRKIPAKADKEPEDNIILQFINISGN